MQTRRRDLRRDAVRGLASGFAPEMGGTAESPRAARGAHEARRAMVAMLGGHLWCLGHRVAGIWGASSAEGGFPLGSLPPTRAYPAGAQPPPQGAPAASNRAQGRGAEGRPCVRVTTGADGGPGGRGEAGGGRRRRDEGRRGEPEGGGWPAAWDGKGRAPRCDVTAGALRQGNTPVAAGLRQGNPRLLIDLAQTAPPPREPIPRLLPGPHRRILCGGDAGAKRGHEADASRKLGEGTGSGRWELGGGTPTRRS